MDTGSCIQYDIYANDTDALAAARAIDLYKADLAKSMAAAKARGKGNGAAQSVTRTSGGSPRTSNNNGSWSESKVQALSSHQYDEYEEEIEKAIRSGSFNYDLSGGAR
jgi:hypothetical protein